MKKKIKNKFDKWLLLSWKKFGLIILSWFVAVILHNLVYALFYNYFSSTGGDEAFFFIIAIIIIPLYFIISLVYSLVKSFKN